MEASALDLLVGFSDPTQRGEAAASLARLLGVERVLFLVRDPELGVLLPAPGLPQTLWGGAAWKAFLARCLAPGRHEGRVDLSPGPDCPALGAADGHVVMVLLGGSPRQGELALAERLLPLVARLLVAEQECLLARADATASKDATARSLTLATALEATRSESARLNARLSEEHQRKDEFLAMLGHELRNPLAALSSTLEVLRLRSPADAESVARSLGVMARQVSQLSGLVAELLDVSRVSRGRIELNRRHVLLGEILEDAIEEARPLFEARQQRLVCSVTPERLSLKADALRLAQVFGNLFNNAAKYSERGTDIALIVVKEEGQAVIRIVDQGIGISADMLPRVFDLFVQGPVSHDRSQGGLGIGLTLVKTLVELHDGQVVAQSEGLGRGSTFTVRLPLIAQDVPVRPALGQSAPSALPLRVLVVDDNHDAADSLGGLLELLGHTAEVTYGGPSALELVSSTTYDLVILDIGLPGMDGYEVARHMRPLVGATPLVALTGYSGEDRRRDSRAAGFAAHVVKPVSLDELTSLLNGLRKP
ncbi:MAG: hybrid sensor histidine kinase/response regulator [Archangium sp.]|nr:hybrid sensor histidine kinase/response regulator [Archangium sp.]MDP3571579.1 hybrid sensor histidine kinase/response regulator [Archangium sp.]